MKKGDIIFGGILLLACVLLFLETGKFYIPPTSIDAPPSLWPRIILTLLIAMLILLIVRAVKKKDGSGAGRIKLLLTKESKRVISAIAATVIFLLIFKRVGFMISVFSYFLAATFILEPTKSVKEIVIRVIQAVALVAFIFFVFGKGLSVQLPSGDWFK